MLINCPYHVLVRRLKEETGGKVKGWVSSSIAWKEGGGGGGEF